MRNGGIGVYRRKVEYWNLFWQLLYHRRGYEIGYAKIIWKSELLGKTAMWIILDMSIKSFTLDQLKFSKNKKNT